MARRRAKQKRMTITQMYNRYAIGLRYYGQDLETKNRATRKQLKEIKKLSSQIRQEQRAQGITDLPTIAQAYKYMTEPPAPPKSEELEPLPYSDEPLDLTKFEYPVIEEFYRACERVLEDARVKYVWNERALTAIMDEVTKLRELFDTIYSEFGRSNQEFAHWLSDSDEFEQFKYLEFQDSDGAQGMSTMENFADELQALYNEYKNYQSQTNNTTYIAPTDIRFDV